MHQDPNTVRFVKWNVLAVITIFSAIIGTFIPLIIQYQYLVFFQVPKIHIDIKPEINGNKSTTQFIMTNKGYGPASNISFVIYSSQKIIDITNNFSNTEIFYPVNHPLEINTKQPIDLDHVKLIIPELISLPGSKVSLITTMDLTNNNGQRVEYYSSAVYDQGAVEGVFPNNYGLSNGFDYNLSTYYFMLYASLGIYFFFYFARWRKHKALRNAIRIAITIKDLLKDPVTENQSLSTSISNLNPYISANLEMKGGEIIQKIYYTLLERENNLWPPYLSKYNNKLLNLVDDLWIMDKMGFFS